MHIWIMCKGDLLPSLHLWGGGVTVESEGFLQEIVFF